MHDIQSARHASVDGGRFGNKGSFYVDSNAPPRRQQLREEGIQDNRVVSNPFDGTVIGPRATRQMSLGPGVGVGSLGEYISGGGGNGLGAFQEHPFGGMNNIGGLSNGSYMSSATSPPPRLAPRYFSAAPGDGAPRSALSPILSPSNGSTSSAFSSLSGMVSPHQQQAQPLAPQAPSRSAFSPFHNDMFGSGVDQPFDERDPYKQADSFTGHFSDGGHLRTHGGGGSATLYNSNTFAPFGGNSGGE